MRSLSALNKNAPEYPAAVAAAAWVDRRIDEEIARRRTEPTDDIIGMLVASRPDGVPLPDRDIHMAIVNVLFGGVDTTTALTSHTLMHLWHHIYQMISAHNFAPGNAGVIFYTDIFLPIIGFALLGLQHRQSKA